MEFIARVFVETAATMLLLACVNSADLSNVDGDLSGFVGLDSLGLSVEAPPIPATYYMEYDSPMVRF